MSTLVTAVGGATSDAYDTLVNFKAWCLLVSKTPSVDDEVSNAAIRRGTTWLDGIYAKRWPGVRANGRSQRRAWPRLNALDFDGAVIDSLTIPQEVIWASFEAAMVETLSPNTLSPSVTAGSQKTLVKMEGLEWKLAQPAGGSVQDFIPTLTAVEILLQSILTASRPYFMVV